MVADWRGFDNHLTIISFLINAQYQIKFYEEDDEEHIKIEYEDGNELIYRGFIIQKV
jgi:hypothetical protein